MIKNLTDRQKELSTEQLNERKKEVERQKQISIELIKERKKAETAQVEDFLEHVNSKFKEGIDTAPPSGSTWRSRLESLLAIHVGFPAVDPWLSIPPHWWFSYEYLSHPRPSTPASSPEKDFLRKSEPTQAFLGGWLPLLPALRKHLWKSTVPMQSLRWSMCS